MTLITVLKKTGEEIQAKIDTEDVPAAKEVGIWFAEWNKELNGYVIQNISATKKNKKGKPLKQTLQSVILNVSTNAPISHVNGDFLDNRKRNLEVVERNSKNEYEIVDADTIAILLQDKYGRTEAKALISKPDLNNVVNKTFIWVLQKVDGVVSVIANTPNGRVNLERLISTASDDEKVKHINYDRLDNTRKNLKKTIIIKDTTKA